MERDELESLIGGLTRDLESARAKAAAAVATRDAIEQAIASLQVLLAQQNGAASHDPTVEVSDSDRSGAARATIGLTASAVGQAFNPTVVVTPGAPLKGKKALLAVMREHPGRAWSAEELVRELERRGWAPSSPDPEGVTRVTLRRLVKDSTGIERVAYGRYAYQPKEAPLRSKP